MTQFSQHVDLYEPPEQALDFLAMDANGLTPILGAEIEWSNEQGPRSTKHEEAILRKVWGEKPTPAQGHVVAALYDLGRLLAFNPPYMVLDTCPPRDGIERIVEWVGRMYRRAERHRAIGRLLISIDRDDSIQFHEFGRIDR